MPRAGVMSEMVIPRQLLWLLWKHPRHFRVELHSHEIRPEICWGFRQVLSIHKVVLKTGASIRKALRLFHKFPSEIKRVLSASVSEDTPYSHASYAMITSRSKP
jgi:hypothetical protein